MVDVKANVQRVLGEIESAVHKAGRSPGSVTLVGVCKTVETARILAALDAGVVHLGENKVQEAAEKSLELRSRQHTLHMIGPLQKNKANKAAEIFDWIESVDDLDLARRLERACERLNKTLPVLVQVNLGKEETKSGLSEEEVPEFLRQMAALKMLSVRGLMIVPPYLEDPEAVRPYFRSLRKLAEKIGSSKLENISMMELSMGMSHDFTVAIEEGATIVRVGSAIFGARH